MSAATLDRPQLAMRERRKNPDHHSVMLGRALLLRNNLSPVIIRAGRVWDDPLYKLLKREPQPQPFRVPLAIVPGEVVGPDEPSSEAA